MPQIDLTAYPIKEVLPLLIRDKTTKENIIFAEEEYAHLGEGYSCKDQITLEKLKNPAFALRRRVDKNAAQQQDRTKANAEVMTPAWVINKMVSHADEEWFGRPSVFNVENEDHSWTVVEGKIEFPECKTWQDYIDTTRIEITCGEAPYIVSRYDTTTGVEIPVPERIGMLDRKLRVVGENTSTEEEWMAWAIRAYQSVYGYEFQGDNLLVARINLLMTFVEYMKNRWGRKPEIEEIRKIANIIVWNIWQMDGLTKTIPFSTKQEEQKQEDMFSMFFDAKVQDEEEKETPACRIYDWRAGKSIAFDTVGKEIK